MPDFYGKNNLEKAYIDQILDTIQDLAIAATPYILEKHENKAKKVNLIQKHVIVVLTCQSELPRPIPRNSVDSDHGCISRIYFDNVGDNETLTLYNVTLTSTKPC